MKAVKNLVKFALSLGLLLWVLDQVGWDRIWNLVAQSDLFCLFGALLLFNASKLLSAWRLNLYFQGIGLHIPQSTNCKLYYLGMFYNLFLPGGIGGDGYKVYLLQRATGLGFKPLLQASLLDRFSGLFALLFLAGLLLPFSTFAKKYPLPTLTLALLAILTYPLAIWLEVRLFPSFAPTFPMRALSSLALQLLQLLSALCLLLALPSSLPLIDTLSLFLLSSVAAALPLTIGGVGAREATLLLGLTALGIDPAPGIAFGLLFFLVSALSSALGLLWINRADELASQSRCSPDTPEAKGELR
ncbi:MAG: TIGR00374 family protein [Nitratiruptor sp.]|nr:TIGR00374 family protein [Nitratiruptor sp.]NPA83906.1 flippase-like domain-containing protein [Campylobacterota bacterium]